MSNEEGYGAIPGLSDSKPFFLETPLAHCRGVGMQSTNLMSPDNPFTLTTRHLEQTKSLEYAGSPLEAYYTRYQPRSAAEILGLSWTSRLATLPPLAGLVLPWNPWPPELFVAQIRKATGQYWQKRGIPLDASHGATEFGPVSMLKGIHEIRRLAEIAASLKAHGFCHERGTIYASLLLGDAPGHWACHIRDGLHRISVLAAIGSAKLPILIKGDDSPAIVRRAEVESWYQVRSGHYTRAEALQVFDRLVFGH